MTVVQSGADNNRFMARVIKKGYLGKVSLSKVNESQKIHQVGLKATAARIRILQLLEQSPSRHLSAEVNDDVGISILLFYKLILNFYSQVKAKFDEVMAIHDEVMPKMGAIRKLKQALQDKAQAIAPEDSLGTKQQALTEMVAELEAANGSMMVWMRAFSEPKEGTAHEEVLKFYEQELSKVMGVREKMLGAIEKAEGM
jgi:hypothetical protein